MARWGASTGRRSHLGWGLVGLVLVTSAAAAKETLTTCADVCDTLSSTQCVISTTHTVAAGSDIDCTGARAIEIDGGKLQVHDGAMTLRGKSLVLRSNGRIEADCPQSLERSGVRVVVQEGITFESNGGGKITALCEEGGGSVALAAGGTVTVNALGIDASGSSADAPGGDVRIDAEGNVVILAPITASAKANAGSGTAPGGSIEVFSGGYIAIHAPLEVKGYGGGTLESPGGHIVLDATGHVQLIDGLGLNAETAKGGGGSVDIRAGGTAQLAKPIRVNGTGTTGVGGGITVDAEQVQVSADLKAVGGQDGGTIALEAGGGGLTVATGVEVDATGNNGEQGGDVSLEARGSHVTVDGATVRATAASGGSGGAIRLAGVDVTTTAGARLFANGANPNDGTIDIEARGALTLAGTIEANNGGRLVFVHRDGTPSIAGTITGYDLFEQPGLPPACGDGIRLAGVEVCDGADLGGATCASVGQGSGVLGCATDCSAFDVSGCSGS